MPQSPKNRAKNGHRTGDEVAARCFGLRIESHLMQVAIATPSPRGPFQLSIDEVQCSAAGGWLSGGSGALLVEGLETLVDRHHMRRQKVAVSLDGDYCVTRVTMGSSDEVDRELTMLAERVPRYLQLGPGEKVTGNARKSISPTVDYAVTGVVNRSLIQLVYEALREIDIDMMWVEPSLVSVARLVGQAELWGDQPIMIADGMGKQWDVGIACSGRLLLDYRPAAAKNEEAFRESLDGHITRLRRFCHRHRHIATGELSQLLICGASKKSSRAIDILGDSLGLQPSILEVPKLPHLYEIADQHRQSRSVPAVATVFPLIIDTPPSEIPDLLMQVRRAPDRTWTQRLLYQCWPIVAACVVLGIAYGLVSSERQRHAGTHQGRAQLETEIAASKVKFAELAGQREWLQHLNQIKQQSKEPKWNRLLGQITQCLPDSAKLNEFRVESGGEILMDGTTIDETVVYELVHTLRHLPSITQVALKGTSPEQQGQSTRFAICLATAGSATTSLGAEDE